MKQSKYVVFALLAGVVFCAGARPACAETTWYVDDDGPADFATIQAALDAAYHGDTIIVRDGTYTGVGNRDIDFNGKAVHLKSENGPENCTIDAEGSGRCFHLHSGEGRDSVVEGFTLRGGSTDTDGGGFLLRMASPTITGNLITGNHADNGGSALYASPDSDPLLSGNTIEGNTCTSGTIFIGFDSRAVISGNTIISNVANQEGGGIATWGSPMIDGNLLSDNESSSGGGIYVETQYGNKAIITGNTIADNTASFAGGGVWAGGRESEFVFARNAVVGNEVTGGKGGGLFMVSYSGGDYFLDVAANTIADNVASSSDHPSGGGLHFEARLYSYNVRLLLSGNTIVRNTCGPGGEGGGMRLELGGLESTTWAGVFNNVIAENIVSGDGGGVSIFFSWIGPSCFVRNNTVARNQASDYGGVRMHWSTIFENNVVWNNTAGRYNPQLRYGIVRYSAVEGGYSSGTTWGRGNIDADPLFADPDNGDYHLKSEYGRWDPAANGGEGAWAYDDVTSPCIDAGDPEGDYSKEPEWNGGRLNMGAYGNTAEASQSGYVLTVRSEPFGGVIISGDRPGTTSYTSVCPVNGTASLTAPSTLTRGTVRYDFVRWSVDGEDRPEGQKTASVVMGAPRTMTAHYRVRTHRLDVRSVPIAGVEVTGDKPGVTEYAATCADQEIVSLSAAASVVSAEGVRYNFARWSLDGVSQPEGAAAVVIAMADDRVAVAEYVIETHSLTVDSTPIISVAVTGNKPGTTSYVATCDDQQRMTLVAPVVAVRDEQRYDLVRWVVDGSHKEDGETAVEILMDRDRQAVVQYRVRKHTLTVQSSPITEVSIAGDMPGLTDYSATFDDQEMVNVNLASPPTLFSGGKIYTFIYWLLDGAPQPSGQTDMLITMDADHVAEVVYNMFGDANGDCTVNVLDLIFVRNHLRLDPATDENWRADVNQDGAIDVLDLIKVRNELGARCGE